MSGIGRILSVSFSRGFKRYLQVTNGDEFSPQISDNRSISLSYVKSKGFVIQAC